MALAPNDRRRVMRLPMMPWLRENEWPSAAKALKPVKGEMVVSQTVGCVAGRLGERD